MQAVIHYLAEVVALGLEVVAVVLVTIGGLGAIIRLVHNLVTRGVGHAGAREVYIPLARWLMLALEFTLAADVVNTAIAPDWDDIGRLAAIAVIRTFLNAFLGHDLERARDVQIATEQPQRA